MEMRIYDRNLTGASSGCDSTRQTQKPESGSAGGAESSGRSTGADQVEFSGALGRLSQALSTQGSERAARVAALASAYRSGNYQPNALGASHGMIAEALSAAGGQ